MLITGRRRHGRGSSSEPRDERRRRTTARHARSARRARRTRRRRCATAARWSPAALPGDPHRRRPATDRRRSALRATPQARSGTVARSWSRGPRAFHTATMLGDGRVLLAGGCQSLRRAGAGTARAATTEIYDPRADSFAPGRRCFTRARRTTRSCAATARCSSSAGAARAAGRRRPKWSIPTRRAASTPASSSGAATGLPTGARSSPAARPAADATMSLWLSPGEAPLTLPPLAASAARPDGDRARRRRACWSPAAATARSRSSTAARGAPRCPPRSAPTASPRRALADGTVLLTGGRRHGQPAARAVFFHSPLSPWASLPPLTLDGSTQSLSAAPPRSRRRRRRPARRRRRRAVAATAGRPSWRSWPACRSPTSPSTSSPAAAAPAVRRSSSAGAPRPTTLSSSLEPGRTGRAVDGVAAARRPDRSPRPWPAVAARCCPTPSCPTAASPPLDAHRGAAAAWRQRRRRACSSAAARRRCRAARSASARCTAPPSSTTSRSRR